MFPHKKIVCISDSACINGSPWCWSTVWRMFHDEVWGAIGVGQIHTLCAVVSPLYFWRFHLWGSDSFQPPSLTSDFEFIWHGVISWTGTLELGMHAWLVSPRGQHIFLPCRISLPQTQGNWELVDSSREFTFPNFLRRLQLTLCHTPLRLRLVLCPLLWLPVYEICSLSFWLRLIELTVDTLRCLPASRIKNTWNLDPWHSIW